MVVTRTGVYPEPPRIRNRSTSLSHIETALNEIAISESENISRQTPALTLQVSTAAEPPENTFLECFEELEFRPTSRSTEAHLLPSKMPDGPGSSSRGAQANASMVTPETLESLVNLVHQQSTMVQQQSTMVSNLISHVSNTQPSFMNRSSEQSAWTYMDKGLDGRGGVIPKFDGKTVTDFKTWSNEVNIKRQYCGWSEKETMDLVVRAISGEALETIDNMIGIQTLSSMCWAEFRAAVEPFFPGEVRGPALYDQMKELRQGQSEEVKDYLRAKISLISRSIPSMDEVTRIYVLREGLSNNIRRELDRKVFSYDKMSISEFSRMAIEVDNMTRTWKTDSRCQHWSSTASSQSAGSHRASTGQSSTTSAAKNSENSSSTTTPEKDTVGPSTKRELSTVICHGCNKLGHYATFCPNRVKPRLNVTRPGVSAIDMMEEGDSCGSAINGAQDFICDIKDIREPAGSAFYVDVVLFDGEKASAMIDSGAGPNVTTVQFLEKHNIPWEKDEKEVILADNSKSSVLGKTNFKVKIGGDDYELQNVQVWSAAIHELIIGIKLLEKFFVIDWVACKLYRHDNIIIYEKSPARFSNLSKKRLVGSFVSAIAGDAIFTIGPNLSQCQSSALHKLLSAYEDRFASSAFELPTSMLEKFNIKLRCEPTFCDVPRRLSPHIKDRVEKQILEMLSANIIRRSSAPVASAIVPVRKAGLDEIRVCIDYRKLNALTIPLAYPLRLIDELLQSFRGARYFCTMDLLSGYWQVELDDESIPLTAFTTHLGLFEFLKMPFGLKNAPGWFQRQMDRIFCECHESRVTGVGVYLDDVMVWGRDFEEFMFMLTSVLEVFRRFNLKAKFSKCKFGFDSINYLGHEISVDGIRPLSNKIQLIEDLRESPPRNLKQLRRFLGLTSYYRSFIKDYTNLAAPLYELLKKNVTFNLTLRRIDAYQRLVDAFSGDLMAAYFNPEELLVIETDASNVAVAAILQQPDVNRVLKVIAYCGRSLRDEETRYHTTEKELLALVVVVRKYRHFVQGRKILWSTDHQALKHLATMKLSTDRLQRWITELMDLDIDVWHERGVTHHLSDLLSRQNYEFVAKEIREKNVVASVLAQPKLHESKDTRGPVNAEAKIDITSERFERGQKDDNLCRQIRERLKTGALATVFTEDTGLLMKMGMIDGNVRSRIVVPSSLRDELLKCAHGPDYIGHPGQKKTLRLLATRFWWPNMGEDVAAFLRKCESCQYRKLGDKRVCGKMVPLMFSLKPILDRPFAALGMDVIILADHPTKRKNRYILTMVDFLTRYAIAIPMREQSAGSVLTKLVEHLFSKFGLPKLMITDRGTNFTSDLMKTVMHYLNVQQKFTTAYHPQANGLCERFNGTLKKILGHYISRGQGNWDELLFPLVYSYNILPNDSTKSSPFYLVFGHEGCLPGAPNPNEFEPRLARTKESVRSFRFLWDEAKIALEQAAISMKERADVNRINSTFAVGDLVLLLNLNPSSKVNPAFRVNFGGPYIINELFPPVNVSLIHLGTGDNHKVHVNRIKRYF